MIRSKPCPGGLRRGASACIAAALLTISPLCSAADAPCLTFRVRPQDQIWAFSTRCLGCPNGASDEPAWNVWRYDPAQPRWLNSSADEFYREDSADAVTAMYLHGNRIESGEALQDGLNVYFQTAGYSDEAPPVRFVVWSWPSDQIHGPLKDVRSKAARSDVDAYYLARFLDRLQPDVKVGLLGYSFGARIIAGALHTLGGGQTVGLSIAATDVPRIHVAFWAGGGHDYWLLPGQYHGKALAMADRWLITYNRCDPVLARYRFVDKCSNPVALGYSGMAGRNQLPPEIDARIEEQDVTPFVGRSHDMNRYLYSPPIISRTREFVLGHELPGQRAAARVHSTAPR
jgi:hypothetical protein